MWQWLGRFVLQFRLPLLISLLLITAGMGYLASKVELSYEFTRAIPLDNPKYKAYQAFREKFGEDGNLLVIGVETDRFFELATFKQYISLQDELKKVNGVEDILSIPATVNLVKDSVTEKLQVKPIFDTTQLTAEKLDSSKLIFESLPFYQGLLYNPETNAYLMGLRINKDLLNSKKREKVIQEIDAITGGFENKTGLKLHKSGLPYIRSKVAIMLQEEMRFFLIASVILSALILLLFFRSISAMLLSIAVVGIGVIWSVGTLQLFGFKISLLTALIPPLVVVIGIPNCIYFLNKFHVAWNQYGDKRRALVMMVDKMGIVTLFCNVSAAIGFAVFALTSSQILKEFGLVAGINIMALFFISLIFIPAVLSYLPPPKTRHTKYLDNPQLNRWLARLEKWSLNHRPLIYGITTIIMVISIAGLFKLRSEAFIVDDLPKSNTVYTDLKFFEKHFKGVMPLEIVVDTKKKQGVTRNLKNLEAIDSLSHYLATIPGIARPLSLVEGLKFARQAFFDGDPSSYTLPNSYDLPALAQYLSFKDTTAKKNSLSKLVGSFMDKNKQQARISVNMADIGSYRLPLLLDSIQQKADSLFNTSEKRTHEIELTGTSVTFLEGSRFIINGLKESIFWAFLLISLCMLYLFRSARILISSLIPNIIPLIITAGVMGWAGVPLKPSTVLVFSVALGIAIDVTIRFLVNYKQELPNQNQDIKATVIQTIYSTGISIIYTSLVLIAGFIIFCFSDFGGTMALGWLTSLTLITATLTNLILLPAILLSIGKKK
ncbi:MAG: RND transporter [Chitinophagaceae bacterium]|nr:RND transporter [Chitinophagaceae bacterium]